MTDVKINSNNDLLGFLLTQASSGQKDWFGFTQQRITGINLVHEIAKNHADKMSPRDVVAYAKELNDEIYQGFIKVK
jgi:hypothetical protein